MAKYRYQCKQCKKTTELLRSFKDHEKPVECDCGSTMELLMPNVMEPTILETMDKKRKIKHRKNQAERIKKRSKDFFVEHEMPALIAEHGIEYAKKMGWVDKKGKPKKKSDLK